MRSRGLVNHAKCLVNLGNQAVQEFACATVCPPAFYHNVKLGKDQSDERFNKGSDSNSILQVGELNPAVPGEVVHDDEHIFGSTKGYAI